MFVIWFRGEYNSYIFYSSTHVFISGVYIWPNLCSAFSAMFSQFSKPLPMMLLVDFCFSLIPPLQRCLKLPWCFQSISSTGCLHVPFLSFGASRFTPSAPAALRAFSASRFKPSASPPAPPPAAALRAARLRRFMNSQRWIFVPTYYMNLRKVYKTPCAACS